MVTREIEVGSTIVGSPVRVVLLAARRARIPDVAAAMKRNVLEVETYDAADLPPAELAPDIAIVWLPVSIAGEYLQSLVRWAGQRPAPVGLIGCATDGSRADVEVGLLAGFDDFVIGRVSPRELAARAKALARRMRTSGTCSRQEPQTRADVSLDMERHRLWRRGRAFSLSRTELAVMAVLIGARGRAVSRAEILNAAWGDRNFDVGERAVDNVVMRLRRKLKDQDLIVTVRGIGFRLVDA